MRERRHAVTMFSDGVFFDIEIMRNKIGYMIVIRPNGISLPSISKRVIML